MRKPKPATCACGHVCAGARKLAKHKDTCEELEKMVYAEIHRIAALVGRSPSLQNYMDHASKKLPGWVWIVHRYGDWSDIVEDLGYKPLQRQPKRSQGNKSSAPIFPDAFPHIEGLNVSSQRLVGNEVYSMLR